MSYETFEIAGRSAYQDGQPRAASLDPIVRAGLAYRGVGDPANIAIMNAFYRGWDNAAALERAIEPVDPPAPPLTAEQATVLLQVLDGVHTEGTGSWYETLREAIRTLEATMHAPRT